MLDITRQGVWKKHKHDDKRDLLMNTLRILMLEIRKDHPVISSRKMYLMLKPTGIGRDAFESWALDNGFRVKYPPNYIKTTYAQKQFYFPDLIQGLELNDINQVWQTDITYIQVGERFYYLTFIIDVYSQRIVGYKASENLFAEANIKALQMALRLRQTRRYSSLIHHSDRGSQYIDKQYQALLNKYNIRISMCLAGWQNAWAERLNGIIKNEYLIPKNPKSFTALENELKKSVKLYNEKRPNGALKKKLSPVEFEKYILSLDTPNKPKVKLYTEVNHKIESGIEPLPILPQKTSGSALPDVIKKEKNVNLI